MRKALYLLLLLALTSCYYSHPEQADHWAPAKEGSPDSVDFSLAHHYWTGYNFSLTDTLSLLPSPPTAENDIYYSRQPVQLSSGDDVVVAEIRYAPACTADSVWVKIARDQLSQGWTSETQLLRAATPGDPISKFIHYFSDARTKVFIACLLPALIFMLVQHLRRGHIRMVHFRDIPSFYPTLLCLCVATGAMIYGSIQRFVPQTWVEFYFSPTLNPLRPDLPLILSLFIASVWAMLITAFAVADEMRRQTDLGDTASYLLSLLSVCIVLYLVFTLTVPLYVGYFLYAAYCLFAIRQYAIHRPSHLLCGNCGKAIPHLGVCPHCGAENK